jgi:hypothetical protein
MEPGEAGIPVDVTDEQVAAANAAALRFMRWFAVFEPSAADLELLERAVRTFGDGGDLISLLQRNLAFLYHPLVVRRLLLMRDEADGDMVLWPADVAKALGIDPPKGGGPAAHHLREIGALLASRGGKGAKPKPDPALLRDDLFAARHAVRDGRAFYEAEIGRLGMALGSPLPAESRARLLASIGLRDMNDSAPLLSALYAKRPRERAATLEYVACVWGTTERTARRWIDGLRPRPTGVEFEDWLRQRRGAQGLLRPSGG